MEIENGNLKRVAQLYIELDRIDDAAESYNNAGLYQYAYKLFDTNKYKSKDRKKYIFYSVKHYDNISDWHKSALLYNNNRQYL